MIKKRFKRIWRLATKGAPRSTAALVEENARLHEQLSRRLMDETVITDLAIRNGLQLGLEGGAARVLARMLLNKFAASGAVHYLEMAIKATDMDPPAQFTLTLQRCDGQTPHQLCAAAEAQARDARTLAAEQLRSIAEALRATGQATQLRRPEGELLIDEIERYQEAWRQECKTPARAVPGILRKNGTSGRQ